MTRDKASFTTPNNLLRFRLHLGPRSRRRDQAILPRQLSPTDGSRISSQPLQRDEFVSFIKKFGIKSFGALENYPIQWIIYPKLSSNQTDNLPLPHLDPARLSAFHSDPTGHTENDKRAIKDSDEAIAELFAADAIVLAAPMWNFSVPSVLKSWIDHIARAQKTFKYGAAGPEGLLTGKKLYIAASSGGIYSEGPAQGFDFVVPYLRSVLGFLGLTNVSVFRAEGNAIPGVQETSVQKGIDSIVID